MTFFKSLIALAVLTALSSPAGAAQTAPVDYGFLLSYGQFRALSPQMRRDYMNDLRELVTAMAEDGPADPISAFNDVVVPAKWNVLFAMLERSRADGSCDSITFTVQQGSIVCAGGAGDGSSACDRDNVVKYAAQCQEKFETFQKYRAGMGGTRGARVNETIGTIADEAKKKREANPPEQLAGAEAEKKPEPKVELRCIYGGFPIDGREKKDCQAKSEYGDMKCEPKTVGKKKPKTVQMAMCNPILFGTAKNGEKEEPFCVSKGPDATEQCLKKSKAAGPGALDRAIELAKKNNADYIKLADGIQRLCGKQMTSDNLDAMKMEDDSRKDLSKTCTHYSTAFARYISRQSGEETDEGQK